MRNMKKNWFYILLSMTIAAVPLISCNSDDDDMPKTEDGLHNSDSDKDRIEITGYNALEWLQGCLVVVDDDGEIFRRVYGKALDESQPTVISVPVADYAAAETLFLDWVAPQKEATKVDGGYDYYLTDEVDRPQGCVMFRAVEGEHGIVARMTVAPGTDLKQISEVNFVDTDFWPENAATPKYEAGKIYYMDDYVLKWRDTFIGYGFVTPTSKTSLPFYCLQGNTDGKQGLLIWLSPDADDVLQHPRTYYYKYALEYLATLEEGEKVIEFYNNNNQAFWNNMLKEMDALGYEWSAQDWPNATGDSEFMIGYKTTPFVGIQVLHCLDLYGKKAKMDWTMLEGTYFQYRYIHINTVPPYVE